MSVIYPYCTLSVLNTAARQVRWNTLVISVLGDAKDWEITSSSPSRQLRERLSQKERTEDVGPP